MTLLVNACEAIDGAGTLTVRTSLEEDDIAVTIADTGRGMTPEQVAGLFEVGFAAKGRRIGMGLGLPAARRIVQAHHGRIEVDSEAGRGTVISIHLPVQATAARL